MRQTFGLEGSDFQGSIKERQEALCLCHITIIISSYDNHNITIIMLSYDDDDDNIIAIIMLSYDEDDTPSYDRLELE